METEKYTLTVTIERVPLSHRHDQYTHKGQDYTALVVTKVECENMALKNLITMELEEFQMAGLWEKEQ